MRVIFMLLVLFLVAGCAVNDTPEDEVVEEPTEQFFEADYSDNVLVLKGAIEKPSPCHSVSFNYGLVERKPSVLIMEFRVLEPSEDEVCAQVISYEPFEYEVELAGFKGVEVMTRGSVVFSESFN